MNVFQERLKMYVPEEVFVILGCVMGNGMSLLGAEGEMMRNLNDLLLHSVLKIITGLQQRHKTSKMSVRFWQNVSDNIKLHFLMFIFKNTSKSTHM